MNYIKLNKTAYNECAQDFKNKKSTRITNDKKVVDKFSRHLPSDTQKISILDIGPGNGQMSLLLTQKGYDVTFIEFAEELAHVAHETAPKATMIVDDFLKHNFEDKKFDGILASAFIHLFKNKELHIVMQKIYDLLNHEGVCFLCTTKHDVSSEDLDTKNNFNNTPVRYRKRFTYDELKDLIEQYNFTILDYYENADREENAKTWMNFTIQK